MKQPTRVGTPWILAVLVSLALTAGCDNAIEPFDEDAGLFSVYGYLTLSQEQHFLRIKDLNEPPVADSARALDATVTLKNLDTGTTEPLIDSVVAFDGIYTHNFRTDMTIQPGATYRLTVERADGRTAQATATMPERTVVDVEADDVVGCGEDVVLYFRNVPESRRIGLSIGVSWNDSLRWVHRSDVPTQTGFLPWRIVQAVVPDPILATIDDSTKYCRLLGEDVARLAYTHYGPDWPADSVLADPTESNVENGLGTFGGLHRDTLTQIIDTTPSE